MKAGRVKTYRSKRKVDTLPSLIPANIYNWYDEKSGAGTTNMQVSRLGIGISPVVVCANQLSLATSYKYIFSISR